MSSVFLTVDYLGGVPVVMMVANLVGLRADKLVGKKVADLADPMVEMTVELMVDCLVEWMAY